jgi:hypothetical protein
MEEKLILKLSLIMYKIYQNQNSKAIQLKKIFPTRIQIQLI